MLCQVRCAVFQNVGYALCIGTKVLAHTFPAPTKRLDAPCRYTPHSKEREQDLEPLGAYIPPQAHAASGTPARPVCTTIGNHGHAITCRAKASRAKPLQTRATPRLTVFGASTHQHLRQQYPSKEWQRKTSRQGPRTRRLPQSTSSNESGANPAPPFPQAGECSAKGNHTRGADGLRRRNVSMV